jgi:hypothetical protein
MLLSAVIRVGKNRDFCKAKISAKLKSIYGSFSGRCFLVAWFIGFISLMKIRFDLFPQLLKEKAHVLAMPKIPQILFQKIVKLVWMQA